MSKIICTEIFYNEPPDRQVFEVSLENKLRARTSITSNMDIKPLSCMYVLNSLTFQQLISFVCRFNELLSTYTGTCSTLKRTQSYTHSFECMQISCAWPKHRLKCCASFCVIVITTWTIYHWGTKSKNVSVRGGWFIYDVHGWCSENIVSSGTLRVWKTL